MERLSPYSSIYLFVLVTFHSQQIHTGYHGMQFVHLTRSILSVFLWYYLIFNVYKFLKILIKFASTLCRVNINKN